MTNPEAQPHPTDPEEEQTADQVTVGTPDGGSITGTPEDVVAAFAELVEIEETVGHGHIEGLRLKYDDLGRAYFEGKVVIRHIDDYALLLKQSQAEIGMTFTTKAQLLPLFVVPE